MAVLSLWFMLLWANLLGPGHEGNSLSLFLSLSLSLNKAKFHTFNYWFEQ